MTSPSVNTADIAVSGLRAEALRMRVLSNNIANARTSRTASGQPYRRQDVRIAPAGELGGVQVDGVYGDMRSEFQKVYQPGPDADEDGLVLMPNVDLPAEMMRMVLASRAYQANAAVLKRYQESVDLALELLK